MTSRHPLTLTPPQQNVADALAQGVSLVHIPARTSIGRAEVDTAINDLRTICDCPRASQAVLTHRLVINDLVDPPPMPPGPQPALGHHLVNLMVAAATKSGLKDIAREASVLPGNVPWELSRLFVATGSAHRLQVVVRGHGWGLLGLPRPGITDRTADSVPVRLSEQEFRVAALIAQGRPKRQIAALLALDYQGVGVIREGIRARLGLRADCSDAALVHRLVPGIVPAPAFTAPAPELSEPERRLLHALPHHSSPQDIAVSAGILPEDYDSCLNALFGKAAASGPADLVARALAWELLDPYDWSPEAHYPSVSLTPAEQAVADLLAQGISADNIPSRCGLEHRAVSTHLSSLRKKLDCPWALQHRLVNVLIRRKLVAPPPVPADHRPLLGLHQLDLLSAVASSSLADVAHERSLTRHQLDAEVAELLDAMQSADLLQAVVRGYGWGLLGTSSPNPVAQEACR
ncbi:helix-turn-helix transcriptional regulator [Streptomyces bauhiniae]|uniref:helix-turn-helix transcriptional regulator n=1 Tax=Streptomyces bauhiniae TaxID=2340725 RepID=UPI0035DB3F73